MKTCFILSGVSGSGKSTITKKIFADNMTDSEKSPLIVVSSLDSYRLNFFRFHNNGVELNSEKEYYKAAFAFCNKHASTFSKYVDDHWNTALDTADVIIVDNTNLYRKKRDRWINDAKSKKFGIIAIEIFIPLNVLKERQSTRCDKTVPENVIEEMFYRRQSFSAKEADLILRVDGTKPIDIDFSVLGKADDSYC